MVAGDTTHYIVFILLTRGEYSRYCDGSGISELQANRAERFPQPQPFTGQGTADCAQQRIDAWSSFLDTTRRRGVGARSPGLPRSVRSRRAAGRRGAEQGRRRRETRVAATTYLLWVGDKSARFAFDFGDTDLSLNEVVLGIEAVRAMRSTRAPDLGRRRHRRVRLLQRLVRSLDPLRQHPDHKAVQQAIKGLDFETPGPQWGRTVPEDPEVAETLEVPPGALLRGDVRRARTHRPAHEPVRVPHGHAPVVLRMAGAGVLGGGRAAERLYLQSGAIVLEALLMALRSVGGVAPPEPDVAPPDESWRSRPSRRSCSTIRSAPGSLRMGLTVAPGLEAMIVRGLDRYRAVLAGLPRPPRARSRTDHRRRRRVARGSVLDQRLHPRPRRGRALLVRRRHAAGAATSRSDLGTRRSSSRARSAITVSPRTSSRSTRIREPRSTRSAMRSIRLPVEDVDLAVFDRLGTRATSSSSTTRTERSRTPTRRSCSPRSCRRLPAGVLVGVHDIFLPDDYPPQWSQPVLLRAVPAGRLAPRRRRTVARSCCRRTTSAASPSSTRSV